MKASDDKRNRCSGCGGMSCNGNGNGNGTAARIGRTGLCVHLWTLGLISVIILFRESSIVRGMLLIGRLEEHRQEQQERKTPIAGAPAGAGAGAGAGAVDDPIKKKYISTGKVGLTKVGAKYHRETVPWYEIQEVIPMSMTTMLQNRVSKRQTWNQTLTPAMLLDDSGKVLYCKADKAGSTTVHQTLGINRMCRECLREAYREFQYNTTVRNSIMQQTPVSFTTVRNPWDRIWSTYKGMIVTQKVTLPKHFQNEIPTFVQFVDFVDKHPDKNAHWQPFRNRCLTSPNELGQVYRYDHVIRIEQNFRTYRSHKHGSTGVLSS